MHKKLFPTDLPSLEWCQFEADGFSSKVSGVLFRTGKPPCCGMPLGGISTGCIDIDVRGVYGLSNIFNPSAPFPFQEHWRMPRKSPSYQPILGLSVSDKTWVLADKEIVEGGAISICSEPYYFHELRGKSIEHQTIACSGIEGVSSARDIHYWGHYPIVDMEFEIDAPVSIGMRAWSPFIPGDIAASNIPAIVFEIHLCNISDQRQEGTLIFNFPGPDEQEAHSVEFTRHVLKEDFLGTLVRSLGGVDYIAGIIGDERVRFGAGFNDDSSAWSHVSERLPQPSYREHRGERLYRDSSSSVAVDFDLQEEQEKVVRFFVAWYAPVWEGAQNNLSSLGDNVANTYQDRFRVPWIASKWAGQTNYYTHMYASRYSSSVDVARHIARDHKSLLTRIQAWQTVIYAEDKLPVWLRDSLINSLALIAEDSYWAQAKPPLGAWAYPEGVFALNESPRGCPDLGVIPCDWYGNHPIVFFFPALARTTLRAFQRYQKEDGEIPVWLGKMGDLPDLATPAYHWQVSLNGMCYVDLVYRLWRRTSDDSILREFYDSVKQATTFTMNLRQGPGGIISMPEEGGMEWFEHGEWAGMATHMGGLRLVQLRMAEQMALDMDDQEYAQQCRTWFEEGSQAMEEEMWTGSYYLNFYEKETGKLSDDVMGYQLDGQWVANYYGLEPVFSPERAKIALETIRRTNIALTPDIGAANFARPDGCELSTESKVAFYGPYAMFPPELLILAMTYMYADEVIFGLELAQKHWENLIIKQRHPWDLPNIVRGDTGERCFGTDYYQNMMLWTLPTAINQQTMTDIVQRGSFIDRIIQAGL
ncbi:MAG: GH116 family glycosyl hydrolase [Anaerolineales bacterium]